MEDMIVVRWMQDGELVQDDMRTEDEHLALVQFTEWQDMMEQGQTVQMFREECGTVIVEIHKPYSSNWANR